MNGNHLEVLEKIDRTRLLKEVRQLTHRRDNMVARIASVEEERKRFEVVRNE